MAENDNSALEDKIKALRQDLEAEKILVDRIKKREAEVQQELILMKKIISLEMAKRAKNESSQNKNEEIQ
uniref:Uncharacterized protein n=1 Tax=Romanomermis culicivorax TaxID=13658 RepID=A0A915I5E7_ROMCU